MITSAEVESGSVAEPTPDEMLAISREIALRFSPVQASSAAVRPCPPAGALSATASAAAERTEKEGLGYRELQAISEDIGRRFMPKDSITVPEIVLLPVDPGHLYAYWNTGSGQTSTPEHHQKPLTLRIYWRPNVKQAITPLTLHFDVPADNAIKRKKIRLPIDGTHYSAALGWLNPDHSLETLAQSNIAHVPAAPGRKRFAAEFSPQGDKDGQESLCWPPHWQAMLSAMGNEGTPPAESPISVRAADLTPEIAELYAGLKRLFSETAADSDRTAGQEAEKPFRHASGLGL